MPEQYPQEVPPDGQRQRASGGTSQHTLFKSTAEGTLGKGKLVEQQVEGGNSIQIAGPDGRDRGSTSRPRPGGSEHNLFNLSVALPHGSEKSRSPWSPSTPSPSVPCWAPPVTSWRPLEKAPPADARECRSGWPAPREPLHHGISMKELKEGPDFLGVKLKYWAPLMTQYQQAKRDGQLTADSQGIPLIVRSGTSLDLKYNVKIEEIDASGNVVKEVGTASRSLDKDYLPFVSKDPFALSWPGSTDLFVAAGHSANFNQRPIHPCHLEHQFRFRTQVHGRLYRGQRGSRKNRHAGRLGHREPPSGEERHRRPRGPDPAQPGR